MRIPPLLAATEPRPLPPTGAEVFISSTYNLLLTSVLVGLFGGAAVYVCSFPASIVGAMYSDRLFFPGLDGRFLTWCGQLLDRHLSWYFKYIGALVLGPFPIMGLFKLVGLHKMADRTQSRYGGILSSKPYPGYTLVRTAACVLFLPFLPTIIAAVVACIIAICVIAGIALYGLISFGRMGGSRYLTTRWAVRDGIRDAMNRRLR